jgi:hypothetical protein
MFQSGIRDALAREVQLLKMRQALEAFQPGVRDSLAHQVQALQVLQTRNVVQTGVRNTRPARLSRLGKVLAIQPEVRQGSQPSKMRQTGIRDPRTAIETQVLEPCQVFYVGQPLVRNRGVTEPQRLQARQVPQAGEPRSAETRTTEFQGGEVG